MYNEKINSNLASRWFFCIFPSIDKRELKSGKTFITMQQKIILEVNIFTWQLIV